MRVPHLGLRLPCSPFKRKNTGHWEWELARDVAAKWEAAGRWTVAPELESGHPITASKPERTPIPPTFRRRLHRYL